MQIDFNLAATAVVVSIVLNLIVPRLALPVAAMLPPTIGTPFATMFAYHINDPITTSIVVALLVFLSVVIADYAM
jgi:hypothetical protein